MGQWKITYSGSTKDFEDDLGFKVRQMPGAGFGTLSNITSDYGLLDGGVYQRSVAQQRQITLTGWLSGSSVSAFHSTRKSLIDFIRPARSGSDPVVLEYHGSACVVQASAFYDGGMELGTINRTTEGNVGLRFLLPNPFFETQGSASSVLSTNQEISACYVLQQSPDGSWSSMDNGLDAAPNVILEDNDNGYLYMGGNFTKAGSTTVNKITRWNGTTWESLDGGIVFGVADFPRSIAKHPNGDIYIAGLFTGAGSAASTGGLAKFNGTEWQSILTGGSVVGGYPRAINIDKNGIVYTGGTFTGIGGVAASYVAQYDGASWSGIGAGSAFSGTAATVYAIEFVGDNVVFGGDWFYPLPTADTVNIALWNTTASAWQYLSGASGGIWGANDLVYTLKTDSNQNLYIGGRFEQFGNLTVQNIAGWSGTAPFALGEGLGASVVDYVYNLSVDSKNNVLAGGDFTKSGSNLNFPDAFAQWNGTTWLPSLSVDVPGASTAGLVSRADDGTLTFGFFSTGAASTSVTTTVNITGTNEAYPVITASGPGTLYEISNFTTGKRMFFNLTLQTGEVVTLDFGRLTFKSSTRGNIVNEIIPGSNYATWSLVPGQNNIVLYISGGAASANMTWKNRYWGIDT